jgi:hypothetical protein
MWILIRFPEPESKIFWNVPAISRMGSMQLAFVPAGVGKHCHLDGSRKFSLGSPTTRRALCLFRALLMWHRLWRNRLFPPRADAKIT